eukprot:2418533-Pleurochrysis_carterae.AAC.1
MPLRYPEKKLTSWPSPLWIRIHHKTLLTVLLSPPAPPLAGARTPNNFADFVGANLRHRLCFAWSCFVYTYVILVISTTRGCYPKVCLSSRAPGP